MPSPFPGIDPFLESPAIFPDLQHSMDEHREPYLEICRLVDGRERLVTSIEVVGPSNKTPGDHARKLYLHKQREELGNRTTTPP